MALLRRILRVFGYCLLGMVVLLGLATGAGMLANRAALAAATEFCDSVVPGTGIAAVLARAAARGIRYREAADGSRHEFVFEGWVFNAALCRVESAGAQVTSVRIVIDGD